MHLTSAYLPLVTSWNRRFLVSVPVEHMEKENLLKSTNDGITRGAQKKNKAYKSIRLNHEDTAAILLLHSLHLLSLHSHFCIKRYVFVMRQSAFGICKFISTE